MTILSPKFAYKQKIDRKKEHLVTHSCFQPRKQVSNKYSLVCHPKTSRIMLGLAQKHRYVIRAWDIKNAYVNTSLSHPAYISPPDGYQIPGYCMKLQNFLDLYGLQGSGRAWWKTFDRFLRSKRFKPNKVNRCLYIHSSKKIFILTHVDDCMAVGNPELMPKVVEQIKVIVRNPRPRFPHKLSQAATHMYPTILGSDLQNIL